MGEDVKEVFRALETDSILPCADALKLVLGFGMDVTKPTQPLIERTIRSLALQYLDDIASLDHAGMKQMMLMLSPSSVTKLKTFLDYAVAMNVQVNLKTRLYETCFLSATNANFRRSGQGVNELLEMIKPEVDWPAMVGKLDEIGVKVLIENMKNRKEYLGLLPATTRGKALEHDLGL